MECLVSDLHDHPQNEFFFDPMEGQKREEFIDSIRTSGVIEPLIITQDNVIVSGHQRKSACVELGIESVSCIVRHYEDHDGITKEDWIVKDLIDTNVQQRGVIGGSALKAIRRVDALRAIYRLKRGGDHTSAKSKLPNWEFAPTPQCLQEVCNEAGVEKKYYENFRRIAEMPIELQDLLESGNLSADVALKIVKRLSPEEQELLFEQLPVYTKITTKIAEPLIQEIEKLRDDNAFFLADEDETSRRIDEADLELKAMRDENERIKSGRGSDVEIELRRERDEARTVAARLEEKNRIAEASLKRQTELRLADSELGCTAEQQVVSLCNLILATATPLSELPTSVFFKLGVESRRNLLEILSQSIDGLDEIRNLLAGIAEVG